MNIETKTTRQNYEEYLNFGWEHTEDAMVRCGKHHRTEHILARDKDMENYRVLEALENKYFKLKEQKQSYNPIDGGICFALFVLFIIPGILYVCYKSKQKEHIYAHNRSLQSQMDVVVKEAKELL